MCRCATHIIAEVPYHLMRFVCRLRFVRDVSETEDVPTYTDSVSTYFMVTCKHLCKSFSSWNTVSI